MCEAEKMRMSRNAIKAWTIEGNFADQMLWLRLCFKKLKRGYMYEKSASPPIWVEKQNAGLVSGVR